jgi:hypothetical protein
VAVKQQLGRTARIGQRAVISFVALWMLVVVPFAATSLRSSANPRQGAPSTAPERNDSGGGLTRSNGAARFNPIVDAFIVLAVVGTVVAIVVTRRRSVTARTASHR